MDIDAIVAKLLELKKELHIHEREAQIQQLTSTIEYLERKAKLDENTIARLQAQIQEVRGPNVLAHASY